MSHQFPISSSALAILASVASLCAFSAPAPAQTATDVRAFFEDTSLSTAAPEPIGLMTQTLPGGVVAPQLITGTTAVNPYARFSLQPNDGAIAAYMDQAHGSYKSGEGPEAIAPRPTMRTNRGSMAGTPTNYALLAPATFGLGAVPSGKFSYGFNGNAVGIFKGVCGGSFGGILPPTSTGSCDLSVTDD